MLMAKTQNAEQILVFKTCLLIVEHIDHLVEYEENTKKDRVITHDFLNIYCIMKKNLFIWGNQKI